MSFHTALVKIEEQKISSEKAKRFIYSDKNGAESIFVGRVRNENDGKKVTGVTYDAHDQAVIKSFQSICNDAKNKFDKNAKIFLNILLISKYNFSMIAKFLLLLSTFEC